MGKAVIKILDAVHCKANTQARLIIKDVLAYKTMRQVREQQVSNGRVVEVKKRKLVERYLITGHDKTGGTFLTGLLPRIKKHCKQNDIDLLVKGKLERITTQDKDPKLKGIDFRKDQLRALKAVRIFQRGLIVFPTGSGKTAIGAGIFQMFPECRVLWLCHTKSLQKQSIDDFEGYGLFKHRSLVAIGGGFKGTAKDFQHMDKVIVVSTIQTFFKIDPKYYSAFFDIVIVDEEHHANSKGSQYGYVMERLLAPRRYGLTATTPTKEEEILTNEGFFGPLVATLGFEEGVKKGIIAKPIIELLSVPYEVELNQMCEGRYANFYKYGIVENTTRNSIIADAAMADMENEIVLIIIEHTNHGFLLQEMFKQRGLQVHFVYGGSDEDMRERVKRRLKNGKIRVAICSKVWREGINIPALTCVIIAHGMKEEKIIVQALGRGMRAMLNKTTVRLIDLLDPYRYLAEHTIMRIQVYKKKGWM